MTDHPRLIVHIGAGKTGSSSIQLTLSNNAAALASQGVKYLGLMLEHAVTQTGRDWQRTPGSPAFFAGAEPPANHAQDLERILSDELAAASDAGLHTLIWSNEWMYSRHDRVLEALLRLRAAGHPVQVICYLRRHDKWVQSAYTQWGLKNKTYPGPIRPYGVWKQGRSFAQMPAVQPWIDAFGPDCLLFNFDAVGDVVTHFNARLGLTGLVPENDNISPDAAELAAWSVYNNRFEEVIAAGRFPQLLQPTLAQDALKARLPPLDALMPTPEDLARVVEENAADIAALNAAFAARGEAALRFDSPARQSQHPAPWEMDQFMLKMIFALQEQIMGLRARLAKAEATLAQEGKPPLPPKTTPPKG